MSKDNVDAFHACFTPRFDLVVQPSECEYMLTYVKVWCNEMEQDLSRPNQKDKEDFVKIKKMPFFNNMFSDKTVPESADEWIADVRRSTGELDDFFESLTLPEVTADKPQGRQVFFFYVSAGFASLDALLFNSNLFTCRPLPSNLQPEHASCLSPPTL